MFNPVMPPQRVISPYTRRQFDSFRERFAKSMLNGGLDSRTLFENTDYKEFVMNFAQTEVIDKKDELAKQRIVRKLSYMSLTSDLLGEISYPVILEYKGHDLVKGYAFGIDADGKVEVRTIPMITSPLIIP